MKRSWQVWLGFAASLAVVLMALAWLTVNALSLEQAETRTRGQAELEERVRLALKAVGPELCGILIDVCCHLKGLEEAERSAGWPQRSGKVVLQLALTRLARHYGILPAEDEPRRSPVRHWGAPDYRPSIDGGSPSS